MQDTIFVSPIQRIGGKVTRVNHKGCLRKIVTRRPKIRVIVSYDLKLECGHMVKRLAKDMLKDIVKYRTNCPECYASGKRTNKL